MSTEMRDRLRTVMKQKRLTQTALAELSGVGQSNLAYILNGRNKSTSVDNLRLLASALGVSVAWLMGEDANEEPNTFTQLKLYAWDENFKDFLPTSEEPVPYAISDIVGKMEGIGVIGDLIAVKVQSSNMEPLIFQGDLVVINRADRDIRKHTKPRVYALSAYESFGIYRVIGNLNQIKLESYSALFDPVTLSNSEFDLSVRIVGRVIDRRGASGL